MNVRLLALRWLKFNTVGAIGILVQLAALGVLAGPLRMHYLLATALAVEAAVLHNFVWHCRWTWKDRAASGLGSWLGALWRFHAGNGLVSLLGNLVFMRLLVGQFHMHYLPGNVVSIALCSLLNFALSEWFVFRAR